MYDVYKYTLLFFKTKNNEKIINKSFNIHGKKSPRNSDQPIFVLRRCDDEFLCMQSIDRQIADRMYG